MAKGSFPPVTTNERMLEEPVGQLLGAPMSRRSVVAAAAWSVPAVSLASATPAFANTSQATNVTIAGPSAGVPASGAVPMTVTVKDAQGQPQAGQPVSFSGPDGSSFDAADGVTNGAGQYTANFNLNKPWSKPGVTITVTAVSGTGNASQSFTVLGSNVLGWGSGTFGVTGLGSVANTSSPSQLMQVFPSPVVQVAQGGDYFTLFRLADGTVWGVGRNDQGQLADGTTNEVYWPPQRVPGLSNVVDLAAGYQTGYAVLQDGTVRSWGVNAYSALGDGSTYSAKGYSTSVVTVQGVSGAVKVAGGSWFGLALLSNGTVAGWGRNGFGQLGDTTSTDRATATTTVGVSSVTDIAATSVAGYALRSDGTIMAWGGNWKGQQGDGSTQSGNRYTPAAVSGITTATSIASAGEAGYALLADKTVVAWGNGENGELGNGASAASAAPVAVQGLTNVVQIGAGYALTDSGAVYAWGPNDAGQLGDGNNGSASNVPVAVVLPAGIPIQAIGGSMGGPARYAITGELTVSVDVVENQIAAGSAGTVQAKVSSGSAGIGGAEVSLTATGNAVLASTLGQTNGNGDLVTTVTPDQWTMPGTQVTVRASTDAAVSSDSFTVLGANALGAGGDRRGALGVLYPGTNDGPASIPIPTQLTPVFGSPIKQFASCGHSTLVLLEDGTVWGVGENGYLQVRGAAGVVAEWTQLPGLTNVKQIVLGDYSGAALLGDGTVYAWGTGGYGGLGDNSGYGAVWTAPQRINELSGVKSIGAGMGTIYALMNDGSVRVCGWGELGQIGDGGTSDVFTFKTVANFGNVTSLAVVAAGAYALKSDGTVWYWGVGGQTVPTQVPNLVDVKVLGGHIALLNDGSVRTLDGVNATVAVSGLSNVIAVAGAGGVTNKSWWALSSDGTVNAWGGNGAGQLGDGTTTDRSTPVALAGLAGHLVASISTSVRDDRVFFVTSSSLVTVDVADAQVTAGVASAVEAKVASGSAGVVGATVALTATDNAVFAAPSGVTDSSGVFQTTVTPDLWTSPGEVVRVTASSGASSAQDTFQVTGANVAGQGAGFGGNNQAVVLTDRVFPSRITQIASACGDSAGDTWWMALLADGTVWTRGYDNPFNQMAGGGSGDSSLTWGKVPSLSDVKQIATMYGSGFALLESGKVMAWGANWQGQLGIGSTNVPSAPVEIPNLSNVAAITVGDRTGYALLADGTVKAWGQNDSGEVGNGTFTNPVLSPEPVSNLTNVTQLAATRHTGIALRSDGTVWSWGNNSTAAPASNNNAWGLVGDGSSQNQSTPVKLTSLSGVTQISGGGQAAYAVLSDKTVMAWGTNANGAVGDGTTTNRTTPVAITGLSNVVKVSGLDANGFALLADGTVKAWGQNNWGQLCDGSTTTRLSPVTATSAMNGHPIADLPVRGPRGVYSGFFIYGTGTVSVDVVTPIVAGTAGSVTAKITAGSTPVVGAPLTLAASGGAALAATSGQSDSSGQLQTTVTPDAWTRPGASLSVTAASGSSSATDRYVVAGANFLAAGNDAWGKLGDGGWSNQSTPVQGARVFTSPVVQIVSNDFASAALLLDGSVWTVGNNGYGQLGDGSAISANRNTWGQIPTLSGVTQIAAGRNQFYALMPDKTVRAWGWNPYGGLGDGTTTDRTSPVQVQNLTNVTQVAAGSNSGYALRADGTVWAWGENAFAGQLGDGTSTDRLTPVAVQGLSGLAVTQVSGGGASGYALIADGTVRAWGYNEDGRLGDGTTTTSSTPVVVKNLDQVTQLSGSSDSVYALRGGRVWAWGSNKYGQLGDGTTTDRSTPVLVDGLWTVTKVSGGVSFAYAVFADGKAAAWGRNDSGQLGDGTTTDRASAQYISGTDGHKIVNLGEGGRQAATFLIV